MAHNDDTELRDLVIEALEKNGSLAKIRALLRANIFLAFEEECDNVKHNKFLDEVINLPEGILSLSIVHEFLEYCHLKNTMFVYVSESRQGKDYNYEGRQNLAEKFMNLKGSISSEPILVTLIRSLLKPNICNDKESISNNNFHHLKKDNIHRNGFKDDQNCTYIVHEDSTSSSNNSQSQSDNSSDEKNKLHLRLNLDNSDTDTSSDSTRDKSCSEYVPNEEVMIGIEQAEKNSKNLISPDLLYLNNAAQSSSPNMQSVLYHNIHNRDSNTSNLLEASDFLQIQGNEYISHSTNETPQRETVIKSLPVNNKLFQNEPTSVSNLINVHETGISSMKSLDDAEQTTSEYTYDFSLSPTSKNDNGSNEQQKSTRDSYKHIDHNSHSSQSSISLSDVADLIDISDLNSPNGHKKEHKTFLQDSSNVDAKLSISPRKAQQDEMSNSTGSPIPSLSNLSLHLHSD